MKILAVSDQIIERLFTPAVREAYPDVRLLVSCGDLPYEYLEFLVSIYNVPLLYVPGNHDPEYDAHDPRSQAQGCDNLDGRLRLVRGLRVAGLGGSVLYQPASPNQYSQQEFYLRVFRLLPRLMWLRLRGHPLDLFIAHSPPLGIHDDDDPPHRGMAAFNLLLRLAQPRYFLHGHTMFYRQNLQNHITQYRQTKIINIYPFRVLEIEEPQ
ncbi:MAG: metallophosphoesterase [Anaerolineales bacterium]